MASQEIHIVVTGGPSSYMDRAAVVMLFDFKNHFGEMKPVSLSSLTDIEKVIPPELDEQLDQNRLYRNAAELVADLANTLQCVRYQMPLKAAWGVNYDDRFYLAVSYFSFQAASSALNFSFSLIKLFSSRANISLETVQQEIKVQLKYQRKAQPVHTTVSMLKAAMKMNIPFYQVLNGSKIFCYGQGKNSLLFKISSNDLDSEIGIELQQNKRDTNLIIKGMGYPTTQQLIAQNNSQAMQAINQFGYPLAVKPIGQGMGLGVNSGVSTEEELKVSFNLASKYSPQGVLIEKHVEGYDHRITVADGKVLGAICRMPALVVGDGVHSIRELIGIENDQRPQELRRKGYIKDIQIDTSLKMILAKQKFDLDTIPSASMSIPLRYNGNISTGGTFKDVRADLHPDIEQMAIDIARYFRLNIIGLDFMTADISKSWKEQGAVIEINCQPGMLDEPVYEHLYNKFSIRNFGRIPTVLLIDLDQITQQKLLSIYSKKETNIGFVSDAEASFLGQDRKFDDRNIFRRCWGMIGDPACKMLMAAITTEEMLTRGLPLDKFDIVYMSKETMENLQSKGLGAIIEQHCSRLELI
jgi:D-alanine-D-alanine ligase-like ATP-grasp enzyme